MNLLNLPPMVLALLCISVLLALLITGAFRYRLRLGREGLTFEPPASDAGSLRVIRDNPARHDASKFDEQTPAPRRRKHPGRWWWSRSSRDP